jgi:hypothetical protein
MIDTTETARTGQSLIVYVVIAVIAVLVWRKVR